MKSSIRRKEGEGEGDAPEEFSAVQGLQEYNEITKAEQQSIARARREVKERRKKWAARLTPRPKPLPPAADADADAEMVADDPHPHPHPHPTNSGMLPTDILAFLAAREKHVFLSDSDPDQSPHNITKRTKKKHKNIISGVETVILKQLPRAHCVDQSLEFLKKRRMQVPRSSAILSNSNQALRLLSSSGSLN